MTDPNDARRRANAIRVVRPSSENVTAYRRNPLRSTRSYTTDAAAVRCRSGGSKLTSGPPERERIFGDRRVGEKKDEQTLLITAPAKRLIHRACPVYSLRLQSDIRPFSCTRGPRELCARMLDVPRSIRLFDASPPYPNGARFNSIP